MSSQSYETITRTIRERRTVNQFKPDPVPRSLMLELLESAGWAPFHSLREPWRYILFEGDGRKVFSDAVLSTYTEEKRKQLGERVANVYCHEVPLHLLVLIEEEPRPKEWEEALCAASTLIHNLQLLAWEQGIGLVWKTNDYNWDPRFRAAAGVKPGQKVVGTLHLGYFDPEKLRRPRPRTAVADLLTIIDSDSDGIRNSNSQ
ncbi:nitroreductase [Paenibacillus oryzae]|uniref:Putative NAD(P)H nitroreductase n=1 Tax=Paenibacillus oryzae TaxID=1844972 RepID=A0A1A5YUP8_9BACL|nr:nitroreductase [Paenibacillus oryzae]OBR69303.1 nitroreductase [Paenibacillus oryzae]